MQLLPCSSKELTDTFSVIVKDKLNPLDPQWQKEQREAIGKELKLSGDMARNLLARALLALDFSGKHQEKLIQLRVLVVKQGEMVFSPVLLAVLARGRTGDLGYDEPAVFFALDKLIEASQPKVRLN